MIGSDQQRTAPSTMAVRRSFGRNASWAAVGSVVYAAGNWVQLAALTRFVSPAEVGLFAFALALSAPVIIFAGLGLRTVSVTDGSGAFVFGDYLALRSVTLTAGLAAVIAFTIVGDLSQRECGAVIAIALAKALDNISDLIFGAFQRVERLDQPAKVLILNTIVSTSIMIVLLALTSSVVWASVGVAAGSAVALFASAIPSALAAFRPGQEDDPLLASGIRPHWSLHRMVGLTRIAAPLGIAHLLTVLNANAPRYVVERELGRSELGIFVAVASILVIGSLIMGPITQVALPRLTAAVSHGDGPLLLRGLGHLFIFSFALGVVTVAATLVVGDWAFAMVFTDAYASRDHLLQWLAGATMLSFLMYVLDVGLAAAQRYNVQVLANLAAIVTTVAASAILVPRHQLVGVVWSMCLAFGVQGSIKAIALVRETMRLKHRVLSPTVDRPGEPLLVRPAIVPRSDARRSRNVSHQPFFLSSTASNVRRPPLVHRDGRAGGRDPNLLMLLFSFAVLTLGVVRWEPSVFDLLAPVVLIAVVGFKAFRDTPGFISKPFIVSLYLFSLVQLIAVAAAPDPLFSFRYTMISILLVLVAVLSYIVAGTDWLMVSFARCYVAGAVATTAVGIAAYYGSLPGFPSSLVTYGGIRFVGFFKDANVLAPYLTFAALLLISGWSLRTPVSGTAGRRIARALSLAILSYGVIIAYSRGAWLNAAAAAFVYGALVIARTPNRFGIRLFQFAALAVLVLLSWHLLPGLREIVQRRGFGLEAQDEARFAAQRESWDAFQSSPLTLRGPNSSPALLGLGSHNVFLQQLFETGVWGFVPFVVLVTGAIRASVVAAVYAVSDLHARWAASVAASLVGLCANSLFIDSTHWRQLWIVLGIGWASATWLGTQTDASLVAESAIGSDAGRASTSVHGWSDLEPRTEGAAQRRAMGLGAANKQLGTRTSPVPSGPA